MAAFTIDKFGGNVSVTGPDYEPAPFSPIENDSFERALGSAIDLQNT